MDQFIARCRSASTHGGLLNNVERRMVFTEIPPEHKAFIESRDMFFLSTIDHQSRPTVSYKGGDHRDMVRRRMMVANGAKRTLTEPRYRSGFMSIRP
jgi:hypothetical protein